MQSRFVDAGGTMTRILYAGDPANEALVLLHGYGGTADLWVRNIDELARTRFVVAPDMIASGFTDKTSFNGEAPQKAAVDHIARLADALKIRTFCASGSSYGALIAALVYFAMPDRVTKLIVNGSGSAFNTNEQLLATLNRTHINYKPMVWSPSIDALRCTMETQVFDPASLPAEIFPVMVTAYALPGAAAVWEEGIVGLKDLKKTAPYRILDRLEDIKVPTLVPWGRDDKGAIYESAVKAVARIPKSQLVTFERCGHKPMFEHTERYNAVVREFLAA